MEWFYLERFLLLYLKGKGTKRKRSILDTENQIFRQPRSVYLPFNVKKWDFLRTLISIMQKDNQIHCKDISPPIWNDLPDFSLEAVNLWKISIPDFLSQKERLIQLLTKDESGRASRYHQKKDRDRFIIGRGMLRQVLANYFGCDSTNVDFKKGINNKPYIDHPYPLPFNVSYSHNYVIIALSSADIGVDIEFIHPEFNYPPLLEACFMEKEIQAISLSPIPRRSFFQFWTRKEALLKATSLGLDDYLTDFSCLDGYQPIPPNLHTSVDWKVKSFLLEDSYWISLAQRNSRAIRFIDAHSYFLN